MKTISSIEMKDKLDEVLWDIQGSKKRYLIKQENEPAAVLVSLLEWEELVGALEIAAEQADEEFQASLREARKDYEAGRVYTLEHLKELEEFLVRCEQQKIDKQIAQMALDPEYQNLQREMVEEYEQAGWEALQIGEKQ